MKKTITILTVTLLAVLLFQSCKKKDNENEKSFADKFAGTYLVTDTLITTALNPVSCADNVSTGSYLLVISKQDDNTVTLDNFAYCPNKALKLTETTIAAASVGCASFSGTYANDKFTLNYAPALSPYCSYDGKLTGVKQQ